MSPGSTRISSSDDAPEPTTDPAAEAGATAAADRDVDGSSDAGSATAAAPRRSRKLLVALALLALALFLTAAALLVYLFLQDREDDRREAAVRAARQEVINLFTIDYKDLDPHVKRVLDGATGDFARDFNERAPQLRELLVKSQVVSQGEVLEAAPVRVDDSTATVLVVAKSAVRNVAAPEGITTTERIQVELERKGDRWLTSSLEPVS